MIATLSAAVTGGTFIAVTVAAPPIAAGLASKILLLKAFKILVSGLKVAHVVSSSAGAQTLISGATGATIGGLMGGGTACIAIPSDTSVSSEISSKVKFE